MSARRRLRVGVTVGIALLLVATTAGYGLWVIRAASTGHLMDPAHMDDPAHPRMDAAMDPTMMGPSSTRGIVGGYLGAVTAVMGLAFIVLVALLAWLLVHERPGRPEQARCPVCGATIETDWTACAFCGTPLAGIERPPGTSFPA